MKILPYLCLISSSVYLIGCGSNSDQVDTSTTPAIPPPPVETVLKCDRGILLNSKLPSATQTIFDEPLFQIVSDLNRAEATYTESRIYFTEFNRSQQMLYRQFHGINISDQSLDLSEQRQQNDLNLNDHGLFAKTHYQKQNLGWPTSYITQSQGLQLSTADYNDECSFKSSAISYDFEKVDLTGKKIADIFPPINPNGLSRAERYTYMSLDTFNRLSLNRSKAYTQLLNSTATFPKGAFIYIPKKVLYDNTQFYFGASTGSFDSLERLIQDYYTRGYTMKVGLVSGYKVAYSVDQNGELLYYRGADPAMEKDGKIHDGLWIAKGDVVSTQYGAQDRSSNYLEKGEFAFMNAASYQFIRQQIEQYFK